MESKSRNVWIVVLAIVVVACCCAVAAAGTAGVLIVRSSPRDAQAGPYQERLEDRFVVGETPALKIDNFAGNVTVRAGTEGTIRVQATRRASTQRTLRLIGVGMHETEDGLVIKTGRPLLGNASLDLEVTTPPATRLELDLAAGNIVVEGLNGGVEVAAGAGTVEIHDVTGELRASSDAGTLNVRGATGPVRLDNGVGSILYEGTPYGECTFDSEVGAIALRLPADANVTVDLETELGTIDLDCDVDGRVTRRDVEGVIGRSDWASIRARNKVGGIGLVCR
ncbi:hypothetical protein ACFLYD_08025 [Chloroflexota bacterium]